MIWRLYSQVSIAVTLLLPALSGCVLHKNTPPPLAAVAPAPQPASKPLYDSELSQSVPSLPELPSAPLPSAQPAPPPKSEVVDTTKKPQRPARRTRGRKGGTEVAERESREKETQGKESANGGAAGSDNAAQGGQVAKVTATTPTGETTQPTSIGQLTAGPTQDTDGSRRQAANLIDVTERGIGGLRNLSGDQSKTVAQIRSFLDQAHRAMHNGDLDGAVTLATKAKLLLDELTGTS